MKKNFLLFLSLVLIAGCKPEKVTIDNVIKTLTISNKTPLADGSTIVYVSVHLDSIADLDKRSVIFETNAGQFLTANDTVITQAATFLNKSLIATVKLKMPITVSTIHISAKPAAISPQQDYILASTFTASESVPSTLQLTPSALGIKSNFGSEIQLTGVLKNSFNNNVSTGHKCLFEDYLPDGSPMHGSFRALKDTTDATSSVSVYYSIGTATPTSFYIKCTYIDASGKLTDVKDSCMITITQ
jgi:hypothetical protein